MGVLTKAAEIKLLAVVLAAIVVLPPRAVSQPEQNLVPVFESAAKEFNVPVQILEGIAFVETRWEHIRPHVSPADGSHMPPAYGVMALRDDEWFGHSLPKAARLLRVDVDRVKNDVTTNIRAAAAYVKSLAKTEPAPPTSALESWMPIVARYSGIPQSAEQGTYVEDVFRVLRDGYNQFGISIRRETVEWKRVTAFVKKKGPTEESNSPCSDDYPPAEWDASPNFSSRSGSPISHVIVHDTEGSFAGSVSWLKNPAAQASAHYIFRSSDGYLKQLVREADKGWHVSCWNAWTIGIEHEGYVSNPAWFTEVMYQQSALLVRHLTSSFRISRDRLRIVGHNIWQNSQLFPQLGWDSCNDHTDPGGFWNWDHYMSLIVTDSTPPLAVWISPSSNQQNVPVFKNINIKFDRTMDIPSTQNAFSIFPIVAGSFRWSGDGRTLTYHPTTYLSNSQAYQITLGATAKGSGGGSIVQPLQYTFTTSTIDTAPPRIVNSYPAQRATNISPATGFQVWFDEPVVYGSFSGRIRFVDVADSNRLLYIANSTYVDIDDKGYLTFINVNDLSPGHTYRVRFLPGIRDVLGNQTSVETRIEFTAQPDTLQEGLTLDPFESNQFQWQRPNPNTGSIGIDTLFTNFSFNATYKRNGVSSGWLAYAFSDSSAGLCRLSNTSGVAVSPSDGWVGLWVFGDNGGNALEWRFRLIDGTTRQVNMGNIGWFGWKLLKGPLASIGANVASLTSIVVRQQAGGNISGSLYFDDLQAGRVTGVDDDTHSAAPFAFSLGQNYPNPFNPSTRIQFTVGIAAPAKLTLFDCLGRQIASLVDGNLAAGQYNVSVDARSFASGVYFYRLESAGQSSTRKMLIMK